MGAVLGACLESGCKVLMVLELGGEGAVEKLWKSCGKTVEKL